MNKIILADSQAMFRTGTAKLLAMDEGFRIIGQCSDVERMMHAITTYPGAIVLVASSLRPDMGRLRTMLESAGSRAVVIVENNENAGAYLHQGFRGVLFRNATGTELVQCVRRVAAGDTWKPPQLPIAEVPENDMVGTRVLDRLTPREMQHRGAYRAGLQEPRNCHPPQDHRAGHQELSALCLRQNRSERPAGTGAIHVPPQGVGRWRRWQRRWAANWKLRNSKSRRALWLRRKPTSVRTVMCGWADCYTIHPLLRSTLRLSAACAIVVGHWAN